MHPRDLPFGVQSQSLLTDQGHSDLAVCLVLGLDRAKSPSLLTDQGHSDCDEGDGLGYEDMPFYSQSLLTEQGHSDGHWKTVVMLAFSLSQPLLTDQGHSGGDLRSRRDAGRAVVAIPPD